MSGPGIGVAEGLGAEGERRTEDGWHVDSAEGSGPAVIGGEVLSGGADA